MRTEIVDRFMDDIQAYCGLDEIEAIISRLCLLTGKKLVEEAKE